MKRIDQVNESIQEERTLLLQHPLYSRISTITHLRRFTEAHVYAVWDFMSLLKALQQQLTCSTVPWVPTPFANTRYLINEIVLAEESDEYMDGRRLSHYEMYLDAMQQLGADTALVEGMVDRLRAGEPLTEVLGSLPIDSRIIDFMTFTFDVIAQGRAHEIASAFTFGREDLIPDMFTSILSEVQKQFPAATIAPLHYYFQRHIELDGDEHGPLAMQMILELGGEDEQKWEEMKIVAKEALRKRIALWDAIADSVRSDD